MENKNIEILEMIEVIRVTLDLMEQSLKSDPDIQKTGYGKKFRVKLETLQNERKK